MVHDLGPTWFVLHTFKMNWNYNINVWLTIQIAV